MADESSQKWRFRPLWGWVKKYLKKPVAWGLTIIVSTVAAVYGGVEYSKMQRLRRPYIAVVVATQSIDFPIPSEFFAGFQSSYVQGEAFITARDGTSVDIRHVEDIEAPEEASRIASEIANDKNCIMVVGNSNSTLTSTALDVFLRSGDPPTYIWPIATASELITKAKTANDQAVLRMVPDNDAQGTMVQRLSSHLAPHPRVAIFVDDENPVYSTNLSRDIASKIRKSGGQIVIEQAIGQGNSIFSAIQAWANPNSRPDVIVWVGVAHHALLLIDQVAALRIHTPIVFTDGALVGELRDYISRIPNRSFVLSPVGAPGGTSGEMPTYDGVGKDAFQLAQMIIKNADDVSRAGLRKYVAENKEKILITNSQAGEYKFDRDGNNQRAEWKVFEITKGICKQIIVE